MFTLREKSHQADKMTGGVGDKYEVWERKSKFCVRGGEKTLASQTMASFCNRSRCLHKTIDELWADESSEQSGNQLKIMKKAEIKKRDDQQIQEAITKLEDQDLAEIKKHYRAEMIKLVEHHEAEVKNQEDQHKEEVKNLEDQHKAEVKNQEDQHKADVKNQED